ncbi:MAG: phenylalanine 4-monooxygenase [Cryomorphaceae bacterium BACL21 MAG-121220-bin10]|nr:MAG: phenylalanine 4-monooxygenase [Cryomorphaceae bacterium BACL21 MAG-121220-bin10]
MSKIETNPVLERLPKHLLQYIKPQSYDDYTALDQAVWRYVMRKNIAHLPLLAHQSYLAGLEKTGISIDQIPSMYGMNRILQDIGWAAVAVDGFIPPQAFMEFQAYNVLVIASDIRQVNHIEYTPAPDIIHEAAGHAPIIANPDYAEYLRRFGEIGSKAISSALDYQMYEAARKLSVLKESKNPDQNAIDATEAHIQALQASDEVPSEMAQIRNLHWWSVEYGLIGTLEEPSIYGAGLLSSIGESTACLKAHVVKRPYTIEAADQGFDITKPQPHLYVTPNFAHLTEVLEEFADRMALRRGGYSGLSKALKSKQLATAELSTGLQVTGVFTHIIEQDRTVRYIQTTGPTVLSYQNKALVGHESSSHADGFGSPIGKLKGINLAIEDMSPKDLKQYNICEGQQVDLSFDGGVRVQGTIITGTRNLQGKIMLIKFKNCLVTLGAKVLFDPSWGIYDMAIGKKVRSVFAGPADPTSVDLAVTINHYESHEGTGSSKYLALVGLYQKASDHIKARTLDLKVISDLRKALDKDHPSDWLLLLTLYEWARESNSPAIAEHLAAALSTKAEQYPMSAHLIHDGLKLLARS